MPGPMRRRPARPCGRRKPSRPNTRPLFEEPPTSIAASRSSIPALTGSTSSEWTKGVSPGDARGTTRRCPAGAPARVCAPDLGIGDDGSGRAGDDVGGRPSGRGTVRVAEGRRRGAGLELVVAGGDVGDVEGGVGVGGSVRLGGGQLVEDAARAGTACAPSAAPPGYTRPTPPALSRSAPRVGRPLGLLAQVVDERAQLPPRHSGQPVSRQAQQALAIMTGGRRGERSGARTRESLLQERVRASSGGRGGERRGDRCDSGDGRVAVVPGCPFLASLKASATRASS
jgi:hypothetical protein